MDRQEAKLVLQAHRPNGLDAKHPAFAEALALAENDPELKAWWEAQQVFDRQVAAKLSGVPVPADLRSIIMAGRKIELLQSQPSFLPWIAMAAMVAVLCVVGTLKEIALTIGPITQTEYSAAVLPLLHNDAPDLAMTSTDHDKIAEWLKAQHAPMGRLPTGMTSLPTVGCQKFVVHGHMVSLVCFTLAGGGIAHLFVMDEDALSDRPDRYAPEFQQVQGWSTATWSDGQMSYVLATQAGPDALKQLL
jgi:hypothetical protein